MCAPGYQGELCAFCQDGYQKNPETNACEPCPNFVCTSKRQITPSLYFFLVCVGLLLGFLIISVAYRLYMRVQRIRQEKKGPQALSERIKDYKKKGTITEQEVVYLAEARPSVDHQNQEEEEEADQTPSLNPDFGAASQESDWSQGAPFSSAVSPFFEAEALCLDWTLQSIPLR